jgi:beta-lactamase class A
MNKSLPWIGILLIFLTACNRNVEPTSSLRATIENIIKDKNSVVGVSIMGSNGEDTLSILGDKRFPMQSVFKFHIALAVLSEVDKGNLSLSQTITLGKDDFPQIFFWNPLLTDYPEGGDFTIEMLIQYSVSHSDNTACDQLIELLGGPKAVETYLKQCGIQDIEVNYNEKDMQAKWEHMFANWTTPKAATATLQLFYENKTQLLSKTSYDFFWKTNKETTTGKNRIKGQLPEGTIVAHKTGWSGTNDETGITDAVNNIGIVFLPNGDYFYISVFITNSTEKFETNERLIADIARASYDYFVEK